LKRIGEIILNPDDVMALVADAEAFLREHGEM
jgi:hypothetical protein